MPRARLTRRPLPPYAFVPGEQPHPTRDPLGHSYGREGEEAPVESIDPDDWQKSDAYLYGVDLYNEGFLWEAHEAWEALWHASKHDPVQAAFIQGLIQCAAGCLKIRMGQERGMDKLFAQGTDRLRRVARAAGPLYMGLPLLEFAQSIVAFGAQRPDSHEARPRLELPPAPAF